MKRKIIRIDADVCNGCGQCLPNCPEGALQLIDGKARLVSDLFCDGLGACIGTCPLGAIHVEEREAEPYDERRVMANIVTQGANVIRAHLDHLAAHNEQRLPGAGAAVPARTGHSPARAAESGRARGFMAARDRKCMTAANRKPRRPAPAAAAGGLRVRTAHLAGAAAAAQPAGLVLRQRRPADRRRLRPLRPCLVPPGIRQGQDPHHLLPQAGPCRRASTWRS